MFLIVFLIFLVVNVIFGIVFSGMYIFFYFGMIFIEENFVVQEVCFMFMLVINNGFCVFCDYLGESLFMLNMLYMEVLQVNCGNEYCFCCYNDIMF